ncbi:hypothetical protein CGMCC3_g18058 [Colletotrichum fructicola]|nr:uncharacterized protein CGMCC3_g18058 [Colletotrichum fructicola]KAE9565760.1 hypothetical protein CGMCC3_g18058 [Colletotrichum fructicola]
MPGSSTGTLSSFAAPQLVSLSLSTTEDPSTESPTNRSQASFDDVRNWSWLIDTASISPSNQNTPSSPQYYPRQPDGNSDIPFAGDTRPAEDVGNSIQDASPRPQVKGDALNPDRTRRVYDCATEALSLLENLHTSASGCLTVVQRPPHLVAIEGDCKSGQKDIGDILSENREALARLNSLLGCPCSRRQDILLLTYLVIAKIADSYRLILGISDSAEPAAKHSTMEQSPKITLTTVSCIGSYPLDDNSQKILSAHLVLRQVRDQVQPLLKRIRPGHGHVPDSLPPTYSRWYPSPLKPLQSTLPVHHHSHVTGVINQVRVMTPPGPAPSSRMKKPVVHGR